jgi:alpha-glucosidase
LSTALVNCQLDQLLLIEKKPVKPKRRMIVCKQISSLILFLITFSSVAQPLEESLVSPDGNMSFRFYQKADGGKKRSYYQVSFRNKPVILESSLNLRMDNHLSQLALALRQDSDNAWSEHFVLKNTARSSRDTIWTPLFGERSQIRDHYNELVLQFEDPLDARYRFHLVVRAYNEGVAFRYYFPENPTGVYYRIKEERTEFTLPENTKAWYEQWAQGPFRLLPLKDWPDESERPLTLELPDGVYACLAEAAMVDYVRTKFSLDKEKPNTLVTSLYESVDLITYFNTPWRVIMAGEKPGDLIEHNDLILNLNAPSALKKTEWIKPGKIIREMTLTNEGAKACIDFAAAHNLQYVLFDWKWYGPAFTFDSDAGKVAIDLDLPEIIRYGKTKNVGIWLYVNLQALVKQDHRIFPLYKSWGVKGVKYGFVQVGSHRWTTWLHESVQRAADNELMVNIHDDFRTTGEQRTWPSILTVEGIRGNEEMPDATHNTILPFTRGIAGAGDYTICYYTNRIRTTHAHQLALGVISYSPLQTLFWYDKPSDYQGEPEIEFFERLPTVWDDTKVLQGMIGKYIVTARRHGEEWFVGGATNNDGREVSIPLDFLPKGKRFLVNLYTDDAAVSTRTKVKVEQRKVKSTDVLRIKLMPSGGVALWLRPETGKESLKDTAGK